MPSRTSVKFRPRFETLEDRALLSASAGIKNAVAHIVNMPAAHHIVSSIVSSLQSAAHSVTNLSTTLTSIANGTATVSFHSNTEHGNTNSNFTVNVTGAAANTTLPVSINGIVVGQIATDASGNVSLSFRSNPHGPNQQAFPANFPANLAAGATVSVGTNLTGTLANGGLEDHNEIETNLSSNLTGTGTATGTISFNSETEHGVTTSVFTATVHGAAPNSTVPLSINGTVVGNITTDANGNGTLVFSTNPTGTQLPFPANFPNALTSGAAVNIGTLTGVLGATAANVSSNTIASATLTGTTAATGSAVYVNETLHGLNLQLFTVSVKGAPANSTLDVNVGGTNVGTIKTDASGNGTLVFSSLPAGSSLAFPATFPTNVGAGTSVSVGTVLNGTLASNLSSTSTSHHHEDAHDD